MPTNTLGQPIGFPVPGWTARPRPPLTPMTGRTCRSEPRDPARHGADLWRAVSLDRTGANWTYLAYGPFAAEADYRAWLEAMAGKDDPQFQAILDAKTGRAVGV